MEAEHEHSLISSRRKRGVVRASVTKLGTKVSELEGRTGDPSTLGHAQRLGSKLESLDSEFKARHYSVVELAKEEELEDEQAVIDQHDDTVAELSIRIQELITLCSHRSKDPSTPRNLQSRKLERIDKDLRAVNEAVVSLPGDAGDACRLQLHQEKVADLRRDLAEIRDSPLVLGLDDSDTLMGVLARLEKGIFECSLRVKQLLQTAKPTPKDPTASPVTSDGSGVKLPKLDVPTFSGNILEWQSFWDQFRVSVHDRPHISDAEKLVYLRQALKDGTAKSAIEGLSRSGEHYMEAVDYLQDRFDRPRLIHQTHVREIMEAPRLKDGSGRELRRFHDVMQQHIRALKAMGCEPPGPFLMSVLELQQGLQVQP